MILARVIVVGSLYIVGIAVSAHTPESGLARRGIAARGRARQIWARQGTTPQGRTAQGAA